uniref:Uncharacterized protein n=1 Tax=Guillardia theta TaxID=55529 RepID=A0A7S4P700_GUITH
MVLTSVKLHVYNVGNAVLEEQLAAEQLARDAGMRVLEATEKYMKMEEHLRRVIESEDTSDQDVLLALDALQAAKEEAARVVQEAEVAEKSAELVLSSTALADVEAQEREIALALSTMPSSSQQPRRAEEEEEEEEEMQGGDKGFSDGAHAQHKEDGVEEWLEGRTRQEELIADDWQGERRRAEHERWIRGQRVDENVHEKDAYEQPWQRSEEQKHRFNFLNVQEEEEDEEEEEVMMVEEQEEQEKQKFLAMAESANHLVNFHHQIRRMLEVKEVDHAEVERSLQEFVRAKEEAMTYFDDMYKSVEHEIEDVLRELQENGISAQDLNENDRGAQGEDEQEMARRAAEEARRMVQGWKESAEQELMAARQ